MNISLFTILAYVSSPFVLTIIGGIVAAYTSPGERLRVTVQHFAAGVVFAEVAVELLAEIMMLPLLIGFSSGVALMLIQIFISKNGRQRGLYRPCCSILR